MSGFSGCSASDNQKSCQNSYVYFLKLSESENFNGIFIKFKPPNQVL